VNFAAFRLRRPGCRNSVAFEFRVIPLEHVCFRYLFYIRLLHLKRTRPRVRFWIGIRIQVFLCIILKQICNVESLGNAHGFEEINYIDIIVDLLQNLIRTIFLGLQLVVSAYGKPFFTQENHHGISLFKHLATSMPIRRSLVLCICCFQPLPHFLLHGLALCHHVLSGHTKSWASLG